MSERFSDEVLQRAEAAYVNAFTVMAEIASYEATKAAACAAMRAVLEGHLAEQETEHPTVTCECPHAPDCPLVASDGSPR